MKTKVLAILYFLTGLLYILIENHSSFLTEVIIKALIIPVLILIFIINLKPFRNLLTGLMFSGLLFSWAGDVVLQFNFIPGLACFLIAQIMYLTAFLMIPGKNIILSRRFYLLIPVVLYGIGLVSLLYNDLAAMRIPVILYAVVILSMLGAAINRLEKVNKSSYYLVLAGAMLFVISDSAIAVSKFTYQFELSSIVIMSTYVTAQFLIVIGFIKQIRGDFE
ncbi:MAG: lysoplasmalogenase [Bacteroidales bacterium]|nr:lysoplasmalogenase [Bacteroidales bacterium]